MSVIHAQPTLSWSTDGDFRCQDCDADNGRIYQVRSNGIYQYLCGHHLLAWVVADSIHIGDPICEADGDPFAGETYCDYHRNQSIECSNDTNEAVYCEDCAMDMGSDRANACDECGTDWKTVRCESCQVDTGCPICGDTEVYCLDHAESEWNLTPIFCVDCGSDMLCPACTATVAVAAQPVTTKPEVTDDGSTVTVDGVTFRFGH